MKLEKAIEILQHEQYLDPNLETPDIIKALLLGIETMKRFKFYRYKPDPNAWTEKETALVGDCPLFGNVDYRKGYDRQLRNIGFWLFDWHHADHGGPITAIPAFIPWGSALMIQELK